MLREQPRVLIVDDERYVADTLVAMLRREGYEAIAAYDGCDALEQAIHLKPELVISDVHLSKLNGIDAVIQIQRMFPDCKALLFSVNKTIARLALGSLNQAVGFEILQKPVRPQDVLEKIKSVVPLPKTSEGILEITHYC